MRQDEQVDVFSQLLRQHNLADCEILLHVGDNRPRLARHSTHPRSHVTKHRGASPNTDSGWVWVLQFCNHTRQVIFKEAIALELKHRNNAFSVALLADQSKVDFVATFIEG